MFELFAYVVRSWLRELMVSEEEAAVRFDFTLSNISMTLTAFRFILLVFRLRIWFFFSRDQLNITTKHTKIIHDVREYMYIFSKTFTYLTTTIYQSILFYDTKVISNKEKQWFPMHIFNVWNISAYSLHTLIPLFYEIGHDELILSI